MDFELPAHVNGLQAHQAMQNIFGDGADVNAANSDSDRTTFSELLCKKIESQPATKTGITTAQQVSSSVLSKAKPNTTRSDIINTGNPLDLAIEGQGYLVLSDGQRNIYTRSGAFIVDVNSTLIDTATGYKLRRIGSEGQSDGFQTPDDYAISIPYGDLIPAKGTSKVKVAGNLSSDITIAGGPPVESLKAERQTQQITSNIAYTTNGDNVAAMVTKISELDQFHGESDISGKLKAGESGVISISGYNPDGTALNRGLMFTVNTETTLGDFINHLNTNVLIGASASLVNGKIRITDDKGGYSRTDIKLLYTGSGSLIMPGYFEILNAGGDEVRNANITVYDSNGGKHVLAGAFVRTNRPNTWDMVLTSVTGDVGEITINNRRIENIRFNSDDGTYAGLSGSDSPRFVITFANDPANPQTIEIELGTAGRLDGLTQFKGISTAAAREQNGYEAGRLLDVSVNNEGVIAGVFSNGTKKNIARLQMVLFKNASVLKSIGGGYFLASPDSGEAVAAGAVTDGAGIIHAGALEKSRADAAIRHKQTDMFQGYNGFRTNAESIKVANEILRELSRQMR
jgi:flagellar hook protein FlgE